MNHWIVASALAVTFAAQAAPPEWVAATVVKVDAERSRVTLDHERIKSIGMEAMVMPFKVGKSVDLAAFKAGDKARFRLRETDGHLMIEALEKTK